MFKKEYQITLWGQTHYVDFTTHVRKRGKEREIDDYMKRTILLCLDRCKSLISKYVGDESFAVTMPLLSFVAKRRVESGMSSLDIITVVKGDDIKMFEGQKFFNISMKGVTYNTFHKRIK